MYRMAIRFMILLLTLLTVSSLSCRPRSRDTQGQCSADSDCPTDAGHCSPSGVCVECFQTEHCGCHEQCQQSTCAPLGAFTSSQALNAHGNWVGSPGESNYTYKGSCVTAEDCGLGHICLEHESVFASCWHVTPTASVPSFDDLRVPSQDLHDT